MSRTEENLRSLPSGRKKWHNSPVLRNGFSGDHQNIALLPASIPGPPAGHRCDAAVNVMGACRQVQPVRHLRAYPHRPRSMTPRKIAPEILPVFGRACRQCRGVPTVAQRAGVLATLAFRPTSRRRISIGSARAGGCWLLGGASVVFVLAEFDINRDTHRALAKPKSCCVYARHSTASVSGWPGHGRVHRGSPIHDVLVIETKPAAIKQQRLVSAR